MSRKLLIKYYVEPDPAALARRAAQYFVEMAGEAVEARGRARIAISGGSTPKAAFAAAGRPQRSPGAPHAVGRRSTSTGWTSAAVPPDDADSNYRMTREALLDHVPLRPEQIHRIEGELEPEAAAARYESELRNSFRLEGAESPRFDLVALGMGADGHTASLFPAHRGHPRAEPPGRRQPRAAEGRLAHHPHLAGHQPRQLGLLPHRRRGQGRGFEGSSDRAARSGAAAQSADLARQAVYLH